MDQLAAFLAAPDAPQSPPAAPAPTGPSVAANDGVTLPASAAALAYSPNDR